MSPVLLMYRIYLTIEFLNVPYPFEWIKYGVGALF
jgi:hypothetical protein